MIIWTRDDGKLVITREKGFVRHASMKSRGYKVQAFINANADSIIGLNGKMVDVLINDAQLEAFLKDEPMTQKDELKLLRSRVTNLTNRLDKYLKEK